jgi:hypothetical protein
MSPWIDRKILMKNTRQFVHSHGYFLKKNGHRISSLVEISVYNSIVQFFIYRGFKVTGENLGPKKSFKYKLTASGLAENYSFFKAEKDGIMFHVLHNTLIQSSHDDHLYFTADVAVANENGATTQKLKNGRRHSFVANINLTTFSEVKHLNPFPEALFNFMGLVLEFMPEFVEKKYSVSDSGDKLCPIIAFTGAASDHSERIQRSLTQRYGINIIFSTSSTFGEIKGYDTMNKYSQSSANESIAPKLHAGHPNAAFKSAQIQLT